MAKLRLTIDLEYQESASALDFAAATVGAFLAFDERGFQPRAHRLAFAPAEPTLTSPAPADQVSP